MTSDFRVERDTEIKVIKFRHILIIIHNYRKSNLFIQKKITCERNNIRRLLIRDIVTVSGTAMAAGHGIYLLTKKRTPNTMPHHLRRILHTGTGTFYHVLWRTSHEKKEKIPLCRILRI